MALIEAVFTRQSPLAGAGLFAWFVFCCMTQHFLEVRLEFEKEIVIRRRLVGKKEQDVWSGRLGGSLGVRKVRRHWMRYGRQGAMGSQGLGELLKTWPIFLPSY